MYKKRKFSNLLLFPQFPSLCDGNCESYTLFLFPTSMQNPQKFFSTFFLLLVYIGTRGILSHREYWQLVSFVTMFLKRTLAVLLVLV